MKKLFYIIFIGIVIPLWGMAQSSVSGKVVDLDGFGMVGSSIVEVGTTNGTLSDADGNFTLELKSMPTKISVSFLGFTTQEISLTKTTKDLVVTLDDTQGSYLDDIVVYGKRAFGRTNTDSPVPIDVIDVSKITQTGGQVSINEIMNAVAPSFTSQTQTVSDGTDHIDPASLRGLGPDQVLVLINGKRRHNTSLLNTNGTVGAGSVGTDMNAIPTAAIKRIEVLRDGASAQYGSDAIAGVINIVLKEKTEGLELAVTGGANMSSLSNHQEGGVDGEKVQLDASYGLDLGDTGGFINFSGSLGIRNPALRNATNLEKLFDINNSAERIYLSANPTGNIADMTADDYANSIAALPQAFIDASENEDYNLLDNLELEARNQSREDYRFKVGTSKLREGKAFMNMEIPLSDNTAVYAFGGVGNRRGLAYGFLREPFAPKSNTAANPNGFLPGIQSDINDKSIAVGVRGEKNGWDVDFSNTYGKNSFAFTVVESTNASLGAASPSVFEAGGFHFSQNTTNLDFSKKHESVLAGLTTGFGAEYRLETYEIEAGAENSYATYDNNGNPVIGGQGGATNVLGESLPGTSQVFGGFTPQNALTRSRNSIAGYADFELDATEKLLISLATRFESFSDFGETFNYKVATRFKATDKISLRAAYSTGFRAPSLHQQFFSRSSTVFDENGNVQEQGTFTNESRVAQLLGIEKLKEETSVNFSVGATAKIGSLNITVDAYNIEIDDRIVYSGSFGAGESAELQALFSAANAGSARFLVNAIDTRTQGVDVVISHRAFLGALRLNNSLGATFSKNEVTNLMIPSKIEAAGLSGAFFDGQEEAFLTLAQPRVKLSLSNTLSMENGLDISLRNVYFGSVTDPDDFAGDSRTEGTVVSDDAVYDAKVITDLSLSYSITDLLRITVGANNLLDVYPTENRAGGQSNGSFPYSRRTSQFGFTGRFVFVKLGFTL